jgi:manganese-dependent inorganic pyrophosphatase
MKSILVTCYVNPDLDGVAGAIGYAEFSSKTGKASDVGIVGDLNDETKYVLDRFGFSYPPSITNADNYNEVILVDASDLTGLEGNIAPEKVIEIIDHRQIHEADKFPNAKIHIELVGAAATLIVEKFMHNAVEISKDSATLLYAAIVSNTLNFKGTVTTDRDRHAAAWLNQTAQLPALFWKNLFMAKSDLSGQKLGTRIEDDFARFVLGDKKVGIAQLEIIGSRKLVDERELEILHILEQVKAEMGLALIFLSIIDLEEMKNFFITSDATTKALLENVCAVHFVGNVAERKEVPMRKQLVPLLKEALEK